jgi:hypothetical protein
MMPAEGIVLNEQTLPCGCVIRQVYVSPEEKECQIEPCSPTCEYLRFALDETRRQGKSVEYRRADDRKGMRDG